MINENRLAVTVQPWGVLLPVIAIALLTVGSNLVTDGIARAGDRHRPREGLMSVAEPSRPRLDRRAGASRSATCGSS